MTAKSRKTKAARSPSKRLAKGLVSLRKLLLVEVIGQKRLLKALRWAFILLVLLYGVYFIANTDVYYGREGSHIRRLQIVEGKVLFAVSSYWFCDVDHTPPLNGWIGWSLLPSLNNSFRSGITELFIYNPADGSIKKTRRYKESGDWVSTPRDIHFYSPSQVLYVAGNKLVLYDTIKKKVVGSFDGTLPLSPWATPAGTIADDYLVSYNAGMQDGKYRQYLTLFRLDGGRFNKLADLPVGNEGWQDSKVHWWKWGATGIHSRSLRVAGDKFFFLEYEHAGPDTYVFLVEGRYDKGTGQVLTRRLNGNIKQINEYCGRIYDVYKDVVVFQLGDDIYLRQGQGLRTIKSVAKPLGCRKYLIDAISFLNDTDVLILSRHDRQCHAAVMNIVDGKERDITAFLGREEWRAAPQVERVGKDYILIVLPGPGKSTSMKLYDRGLTRILWAYSCDSGGEEKKAGHLRRLR